MGKFEYLQDNIIMIINLMGYVEGLYSVTKEMKIETMLKAIEKAQFMKDFLVACLDH